MGILPSFPEPGTFLDRHGRPCPDPDAIRERYAVHGCATFVKPLNFPGIFSRTAAVLMVDEGGDLAIILESAEAPGGRLAALSWLHAALVEPTDPFVAWHAAHGGWMHLPVEPQQQRWRPSG
ncbi:MAG TPA: hypothetical protein VLR26_05090 [Frankiaceae bacterium]|nr:hypothetical protein [Frankiaceae bacterium]